MNDERKTKAQLIAELAGARQRVIELEAAEADRRQLDAALQVSETRYRRLFETAQDGILLLDAATGQITDVNPFLVTMLGYSHAEFVGKHLWEIGPFKDVAESKLAFEQLQTSEYIRYEDLPLETRDGRRAEVEFVSNVYRINGNKVIQCNVRDITARIQAEEKMRRALEKEKDLNNLKSNFVSLTSHEFRTPLTIILSSAEMLEYGHLHRIQTAVKNMTTLLNDILIIGKAEAGKLEFMPTALDLVKFCRDLVEELQLTDKAKHVLTFNSQVECVQTRLDEILLRHILGNLLSNALKYSPPGSIVQFDLVCQAGQIIFQIKDQGIGIPPEDLAHLFETFHRASNVRNLAGTGLGMAIVKKSVELHGGTIDIASQIGAGTTVTVRLPINVLSDA
jgi:PAS domain S-box-containing protein